MSDSFHSFKSKAWAAMIASWHGPGLKLGAALSYLKVGERPLSQS